MPDLKPEYEKKIRLSVRKSGTQPFSITKLNARTISSMGTVQVDRVKLIEDRNKRKETVLIVSVGKYHVHVVHLKPGKTFLGPFDDTT